jgi:hypothetical protein
MATGKIYRTDYLAALANVIDLDEAKKILTDSEILRLSEIAEELTPEQLADITEQVIEAIDLSSKVDKVTGSSLVSDTEIAKIHAPGSDDQDLSGLQPKETGKGLSANDYTDAEEEKLAGIEAGANNYTHPANHPPSIISQDTDNRFVTDSEKGTWNGKEPGNSNIQTHVTAAHASADAQKNSDITKSEIEAKLIGEISSHTHAGGGGGLSQQQVEALI